MNQLLLYLVSHLSFLYEDFGARFVDSKARGPDAALVLETKNLRIRLVRDRGQLFLDFQSSHYPSDDDWFSFDTIRQFVTGEIIDSAELDDDKVEFVKQHFNELAEVFAAENREKTEQKLHEYERARAKRLFG